MTLCRTLRLQNSKNFTTILQYFTCTFFKRPFVIPCKAFKPVSSHEMSCWSSLKRNIQVFNHIQGHTDILYSHVRDFHITLRETKWCCWQICWFPLLWFLRFRFSFVTWNEDFSYKIRKIPSVVFLKLLIIKLWVSTRGRRRWAGISSIIKRVRAWQRIDPSWWILWIFVQKKLVTCVRIHVVAKWERD